MGNPIFEPKLTGRVVVLQSGDKMRALVGAAAVIAFAVLARVHPADGQSPSSPPPPEELQRQQQAMNATWTPANNGTAADYDDDDDETSNMTDEQYQDYLVDTYIVPQKSEWVFIAMHSVVFVVGLIGNALVCVAVYRCVGNFPVLPRPFHSFATFNISSESSP